MKLGKMLDTIRKKYPEFLQYDWDNSGLNLGDEEKDIKKVLVTLEITRKVIDEAIDNQVDLIITHHPMLFKKMNTITTDTIKGEYIYKLIKNDISVYAMHTSFDIAFDGLNDYFMKIIGIEETEVFDVIGKNDGYMDSKPYGIGRIGEIDCEKNVVDFISEIKKKINIYTVKVAGDATKNVKKVVVLTGGGSDYFELAKEKGADILITGDLKYHQAIDTIEIDSFVADFGHYGTEIIFRDAISEYFSDTFPEIEVIKAESLKNPIRLV